ncbi:hypothetical protein A9Q79_07950 [Methylophaga sp. 42_25_T18]|nr:hypothetical protein A9Q79_07950 [Methylophaga sp. 42_25_T18]
MRVIRVGSDNFELLWDELWKNGARRYPLYGKFNRSFYSAYNDDKQHEDCSFIVEGQNGPLAGMMITSNVDSSGTTSFSVFNLPTLFILNEEIDVSSQAWKLVKKEMESLMTSSELWNWTHSEFLSDEGSISSVGRFLLSLGARSDIEWTQVVDLRTDPGILFKQMTKGCRWGVNWGKKNLDLRVIDNKTVTIDSLKIFRELHIEAAGRETRNQQSWDAQFEMIKGGEAFLVFGYLGEDLVSAALFSHSLDYCFYGVSASKRELFNKPISHVVIWEAVLHAQSIGCKWFDLAGQRFSGERQEPTEKELSISAFKRGFGGNTMARVNLEVNS